MRRRDLLGTVGAAVGTALAGCVGSGSPDPGTGDGDGDAGPDRDALIELLETNERWDLAYFKTVEPGTATEATPLSLTARAKACMWALCPPAPCTRTTRRSDGAGYSRMASAIPSRIATKRAGGRSVRSTANRRAKLAGATVAPDSSTDSSSAASTLRRNSSGFMAIPLPTDPADPVKP